MDMMELHNQGCFNTQARFTLKNGTSFYGVIFTSPMEGHDHYCFLPTLKMREYKNLENDGKLEQAYALLTKIDLSDIISCEK